MNTPRALLLYIIALGIFYPLGSQLPNCPCKHLYSSSTKKNMKTQSELGILFRCCGESLNNRTNMIMVEITQKHVSALYPVSLKPPHIRAFKIVFFPHPNMKILFNPSFGNIFPQVRPCIFYDNTFQTYILG